MKICIVTGNLIDNYDASFAFDQAIALSNYGHKVVVLALDMRSIRRRRKLGIRNHTYRGINILQYSVPVSPIPRKYAACIEKMCFIDGIKRLMQKYGRFDLIHSHFLDESYIAVKGIEKMKETIPVVVTEHSSSVHCKREILKDRIVKECEYTYGNADALIAVSDSLANTILSNFNVKCRTVFNVFDESVFQYEEKMKVEDDVFKFVSTGNLTDNKRMDLLIKGFKKAFNGDSKYVLKIFGDGPERAYLCELINELGLSDRVHLMGNRPRVEIAEEYKHSDAFVLLSEKETFGVAYIEAMASGLPVIACMSGGPESFIKDECGRLIEDNIDVVSMELVAMSKKRNYYSSIDISNYVKQICSPETIAKQLTAIYDGVIKENREYIYE